MGVAASLQLSELRYNIKLDKLKDVAIDLNTKAFTGNKLVVLKFDVTNTTDSDVSLDMATKDLKIKGIFNKSIKTIAQVTLLPEALNTFKETIPAGKTVQTVLVFEMTETNANNLTSIVLDIKSSKGTNSVNIK